MKSWVTEVASVGALVGATDVAIQVLTNHPIIPDPWGAVVLGGFSFLSLVLRTVHKQREKKKEKAA